MDSDCGIDKALDACYILVKLIKGTLFFEYIQNDEPTLKRFIEHISSWSTFEELYAIREKITAIGMKSSDILKEDIYRIDNRYNEIKKLLIKRETVSCKNA